MFDIFYLIRILGQYHTEIFVELLSEKLRIDWVPLFVEGVEIDGTYNTDRMGLVFQQTDTDDIWGKHY